MKLISEGFADGHSIPREYAFAAFDPRARAAPGGNRNPHLAWSEAPPETKSFGLICHDPDAPSRADDVNREGREILASLPRVDFFHWLLFDIPPGVQEIAAGAHSNGVIRRGKPGPQAAGGSRHGINDYTKWFAADPDMKGTYYGYDGPAPPWNDSVVHHYVFTVYALNVPRLDVIGELTAPNVRRALGGHVLADAAVTGTYSLNPRLLSRLPP
jgi:hypothetical protein